MFVGSGVNKLGANGNASGQQNEYRHALLFRSLNRLVTSTGEDFFSVLFFSERVEAKGSVRVAFSGHERVKLSRDKPGMSVGEVGKQKP